MRTRRNRRAGFTLVEMIVVITIIMFLAALTALYFPRYQDRESVSRGADQLQGWLLIAKQQARRDGLPTGLRLYVETTGTFNNGNKYVRRIAYIQQPEDVAQGRYVGCTDESGTTPAAAYFSLPTGLKFGTPALPVQAGDYLELMGGGVVRRIEKVNDSSLELALKTAQLPGPPKPDPIPGYDANSPVNYRIIRQPTPLPGEQELSLPPQGALDLTNSVNVCIDFSPPDSSGNATRSANYKTHLVGTQEVCDLIFGPSGALIGPDTTNAQVILWVRDGMRDSSSDVLAGHATLITVQPRTGFIAAHPASSGTDPYVFTKDARSSGM